MDKYISIKELNEARQKYVAPPCVQGTWDYQGIPLPSNVTKSIMQDLKEWEARPDDVFIVTYLKAGTTWVSEMVSCLMHDGDLNVVNQRHITSRVPFLELVFPGTPEYVPPNHKILDELPSPRIIKTHLPGQLLPPQVWKKQARLIYVLRNPKDLAVSLFHFGQAWQNKEFGEFLDLFTSGKVDYGPWWEHFLFFWNRQDKPNVFVTRYEDMHKDPRLAVASSAKFLGKDLSDETLDAIVDHCSFDNMKRNPMANMDAIRPKAQRQFMRKGIVGDWKTHFTVNQNEMMNAFIKDKMAGSGLSFDFT